MRNPTITNFPDPESPSGFKTHSQVGTTHVYHPQFISGARNGNYFIRTWAPQIGICWWISNSSHPDRWVQCGLEYQAILELNHLQHIDPK